MHIKILVKDGSFEIKINKKVLVLLILIFL